MDFVMQTAQPGIDIIKSFESLELKAYLCPAGVWTIGYGHTAAAGRPIPTAGMVISKAEAEHILKADLQQYEEAVLDLITRRPTQNQFDAMSSFCMNVGPGNFAISSVRKRFNKSDIEGAANAFALWNKGGGKVLNGLIRRRKVEKALFLKGATLSFTVALNIERWRRVIAA